MQNSADLSPDILAWTFFCYFWIPDYKINCRGNWSRRFQFKAVLFQTCEAPDSSSLRHVRYYRNFCTMVSEPTGTSRFFHPAYWCSHIQRKLCTVEANWILRRREWFKTTVTYLVASTRRAVLFFSTSFTAFYPPRMVAKNLPSAACTQSRRMRGFSTVETSRDILSAAAESLGITNRICRRALLIRMRKRTFFSNY